MTKIHRAVRGMPLAALALGCGSVIAADVAPALVAAAHRGGRVDALIVLPHQARPSLAPLSVNASYKLRRRALVEALQARADNDQAAVRAWLDARGVAYRAYWIANLIQANLSTDDLDALAQRADVERVEPNPSIALQAFSAKAAAPQPAAVESIAWGVAKINAPSVWQAGYTGQGVVIGGEDTGYQWDHPALKPQYRGWNGTSADHAYNWHDAIHDSDGNPCGSDSQQPCDDYGHGTHTAGTFAGDDGSSHQIGVAPGARWIGCRNMDEGVGTPARYIECMQWMLAPTDMSNANWNPDLAPDVVSNSWTCTPEEGCSVGSEIQAAVNNLVDAGIFFVAGAANEGPSCGTITNPPAIYDASFVVGMTDQADALDALSSRGPVVGTDRIRPDASAPGVNVCSSVPPNQYSCSWTGTSMATPHVAGAAALLMSVNPALKGHPQQIAELLRGTAVTAGVTDPWNNGCGGLTMANWPNYQAGYGRIDVYAAALAAGLVNPSNDTIFKNGFEAVPPP